MLNLSGNNKLIALVSNSAWSVYNFRLDIISALQNDGFRVLVIAAEDSYAEKLVNAGCLFHAIRFNNRTLNPLQDLRLYFQLRSLYSRYKPDFIFHYVAKPNIYGSMAASAKQIPSAAVITGLGYAFDKRNLLNFGIRQLYRIALSRSLETWFLNKEDARVFLKAKIVDVERVKVLPGEGINTKRFPLGQKSRDSEKFRFLMSTRLLQSKGVAVFADAARILRKKNYDFECRLIGFFEPHHPDSVRKADLQRWEHEGLLTYGGFASDVRPELRRADCLVFPSYYNEGVPRCLMEASSMGLPVITSFNKGCKEVILNNVSGYLCHVNDPFDLADKMEKMLLLDHSTREAMGIAGRAFMIERFGVDHIYEEYVSTLQSIFHDSLSGIFKNSKTPDRIIC
jgi:glycosyltransferase involved in cell wall biosynthesis